MKPAPKQIKAVFDHWNAKKGQWWHCREMDYSVEWEIKQKLKHYTVEQICKSIDNYHLVLNSPDHRVFVTWKGEWDKKWNIPQFFGIKDGSYFKMFLESGFSQYDHLCKFARTRRAERRPPAPPKEAGNLSEVVAGIDTAFTRHLKARKEQ